MDQHFWAGFNKCAAASWQKAWGGLSDVAKQRLRGYAGAGVKNLPAMREGMMAPKLAPELVARHNRMDKLIYDQARANRPGIRQLNSAAMPYAERVGGGKAVVALPKNPASGNQTRAKMNSDLRGAEGTHNRSILEHETSEGAMEAAKAKRSPVGKWARTQKAIQESGDVVHSSAHPLVAEANVAGRNPKALADMRKGWGETPAQGQMFNVLKQHGWTPSTGMPLYGRQAAGVQAKAEQVFAPHFQEYMGRRAQSAKKRLRGRAQKEELKALQGEAREFAGGDRVRLK